MKPRFLLAAALFLISLEGFAQQGDKSVFYNYDDNIYAEAHAIASGSADSGRVLIMFRGAYDLFTFARVLNTSAIKGNYTSSPMVMVELRDSTGVIRARREWRDSIHVETFEETNARRTFIYGSLVVNLRPGRYTVNIDVGDQQNPQIRRLKLNNVDVPAFLSKNASSDVLFAQAPGASSPRNVIPFVSNGNIPFTSGGARVVVTSSGFSPDDVYSYVCTQLPGSADQVSEWGSVQEISGQLRPKAGEVLTMPELRYEEDSTERILLRLVPFAQAQNLPAGAAGNLQADKLGVFDFVVPTETFVPGKYRLQIYKPGSRDTITHNFQVIWEDIPLSLRNTRYAIEAMFYSHLITEEQYDQLRSGSAEENRSKLFTYWKALDPTPQTAFNEKLAYFFARVDYAYFNFQTFEEKDGSRTERGKVYILYGRPASINRTFEPNKPVREIWRYDDHKKEFTFESANDGRFKLIGISDVQ